jgi:hypothetical protein
MTVPYFRSSDLSASTENTTDFYLRHPEWASNVQNAAIPVTGNSDVSDYFQRHPELRASAAIVADTTANFYLQHPEWANRAEDVTSSPAKSLETPGMVCESPVDCR